MWQMSVMLETLFKPFVVGTAEIKMRLLGREAGAERLRKAAKRRVSELLSEGAQSTAALTATARASAGGRATGSPARKTSDHCE